MDIENGYYLAKFESAMDYNNVVSRGPWVLFGHYLTVQPWSSQFSTHNEFPQTVVAWVRIPGLSGAFYKRSLLQEIGSLIGKVVKIDMQTDKGSRGQLARFAVQVNLSHPLISKVCIANKVIRVEYESLPHICYHYGRVGHLQEVCPSILYGENGVDAGGVEPGDKDNKQNTGEQKLQERVENEEFGDWMGVGRR